MNPHRNKIMLLCSTFLAVIASRRSTLRARNSRATVPRLRCAPTKARPAPLRSETMRALGGEGYNAARSKECPAKSREPAIRRGVR